MSAFKQTAGSESTWGLTLYGYSVATNIYTNMDPHLHLWDNKPPDLARHEIQLVKDNIKKISLLV